MNTTTRLFSATLAAAAFLFAAPAFAQSNGDHPAVIVKRMEATQTYDYAAQFYGHPAGMALLAEQPRTMNEHPAVIVARRAAQPQPYDYTAQFYAHPAGLALFDRAPIEAASTLIAAAPAR